MLSRDLASLAIDLSPNPARAVLSAVTVLGVVGSTFLPIYWAWIAIGAVLIGSVAQAWRMGLIGRRYALCQLQCDSEGDWWVLSANGMRLAVRFGSASRVGSGVIWLASDAISTSRRFWLLLLPFGVSDPLWRGLQARLRWVTEAHPQDPPQDDSFAP